MERQKILKSTAKTILHV